MIRTRAKARTRMRARTATRTNTRKNKDEDDHDDQDKTDEDKTKDKGEDGQRSCEENFLENQQKIGDMPFELNCRIIWKTHERSSEKERE